MKRPIIEHWEIGRFFGVTVLRGYVDSSRVTARLLWWSHGRFGIVRNGGDATEEILAEGRRSPTAFEDCAA